MIARKSVAKYIEKRDGLPSNPSNVYIYNGASEAISSVMKLINNGPKTGFMIPIPQYPLYSAEVSLNGNQFVGYYLNEEKGWQLDYEDLVRGYNDAKKSGVNVRALIIINPGNPTGNIFTLESLQQILKFAHENKLVVLADEVYQINIYDEKKKFISMKKALSTMPEEIAKSVELFSFHSSSKGVTGECGLRGGYLETVNIDPEVEAQILKLKSISLCSNTVG
jgi:alanine transaminase